MSTKKDDVQKMMVDNNSGAAASNASRSSATINSNAMGSAGTKGNTQFIVTPAMADAAAASTATTHSHADGDGCAVCLSGIAESDPKAYVELLHDMTPIRLRYENAIDILYDGLMKQLNTELSTDGNQDSLSQPHPQRTPDAKAIAETVKTLSTQIEKDYFDKTKNSLVLEGSSDIMPTTIFAVADMLSKNMPIHKLTICCEFTVGAAIALANALKKNTTLEYLDIRGVHNLGDVGCTILANALRYNKTLKELGINSALPYTFKHNNTLNDLTAKAFAEVLNSNASLQKLNLEYTKITELGAEFLANSLRSNKGLKSLWLTESTVDPNGYGAMDLMSAGKFSGRIINLMGCRAPKNPLIDGAQVDFCLVGESLIAVPKAKKGLSISERLHAHAAKTLPKAPAASATASAAATPVTAAASTTSAPVVLAPVTFNAAANAAAGTTAVSANANTASATSTATAPVVVAGTGTGARAATMANRRTADLGPAVINRRSFVKK